MNATPEPGPSGTAGPPVDRALMPSAVLARIRERALESYPEECCGLLVGLREANAVHVRREMPCPNVAQPSERTHRFFIEPGTLIRVIKSLRGSGESVVGFYHSHPDAPAEPSVTDRTYVGLWPETVWLIVPVGEGVGGGERAWWQPLGREGEEEPRELQVSSYPTDRSPA